MALLSCDETRRLGNGRRRIIVSNFQRPLWDSQFLQRFSPEYLSEELIAYSFTLDVLSTISDLLLNNLYGVDQRRY